jgi:predicted amidohydrolase
VDPYDDPVGALERAISETEIKGSLIVLPESFNLGFHRTPNWQIPNVRGRLEALSKKHQINFIAGLTLPVRPPKPYSSAYMFVDGSSTLMCHKLRLNGSEILRFLRLK